MNGMKIAKTNIAGFECFIILSDGLLDKEAKQQIQEEIFHKYGEIVIYNASSKTGEGDLWTTNKYGLENDRHDDYQNIDFEFVLFKDPSFYI